MQKAWAKLKQASAVLQIQPKELRTVHSALETQRFEETTLRRNMLLVAKVAFCLKEPCTRTAFFQAEWMYPSSEKEFSLKIELHRL